MAPTPLTPPSSGRSEGYSPLAGHRAGVVKKRPSRKSNTLSKPASPKFTWKKPHRRTLKVCHDLGLETKIIVQVFNTLYQEECTSAGYQDGISLRTLQSQWQERHKPTCKPWKEVMNSVELELESSRSEINECLSSLAKEPSRVEVTSTVKQHISGSRWRTSTRNTQVQTFKNNPCSDKTMATSTQDMDTLHVATEPLTPVSSAPSRTTTRPTTQPSHRPSFSSKRRSLDNQQPKAVSTYRLRSVDSKKDKFPKLYEDRTRIVDGKHVAIAKATGGNLSISNPIRREEAHSPVPVLLFRFYDDESQGVRGPEVGGELAQSFAYLTSNTPAPRTCDDDCLFVTILNHINCAPFTSEVISTTSNLFFAMRLAAKSTKNPRIKVIRSSLLPSQGVYHAHPYHKRYHDEKLFYNGKYMNSSYHEYLVWAKIPETAVLCDFAFADLERHLTDNPSMKQVLRIPHMRGPKANPKLLDQFKKENLTLNPNMVNGLANFLLHFNINARTESTIVARLVGETIRSFKINLSETTPDRWDLLAAGFAYALTEHEPCVKFSQEQLVKVKEAFKLGLCRGLGDLNWHLDAKKRKMMLTRGSQKGFDVRMVLSVGQGRVGYTDGRQCIDQSVEGDDEDEEGSEDHSEDGLSDDTMADHEDEPPNREHNDDDDTMADDDEEKEEEEIETELEKLWQTSGPRLSQRMPPSPANNATCQPLNNKRQTRSSVYNFSRADEVFEITDRSDDEDYTNNEIDEDDVEY